MAETIKIDKAELQATLDLLRSSIDEFESYTKSFRNSTRDQLKPMNSDFIEKVDDLLDNMKNDISTEFLEELNIIHQMGEAILTGMSEADEEIGTQIKGGQTI